MSELLDPSGRPLRGVSGPEAWLDRMCDEMLADDAGGVSGRDKAALKLASMTRSFRPHAQDLQALLQGQPLVGGPDGAAFLRGMANVVLLTLLLMRAGERDALKAAEAGIGRDEPKPEADDRGGDDLPTEQESPK